MTHGHELRGEMLEGRGYQVEGKQRGKIWTTVIAINQYNGFKK